MPFFMAQKEFFNMLKFYNHQLFSLILLLQVSISLADDKPTTINILANNEFEFIDKTSAKFTITALNPAHKSIESLHKVDAIGVVYLGNIALTGNATPLSVLRDISAQISQGLDLDFTLIADSITSQSLKPHELLMLYHPSMVITLGLTKVANSESYSLIGTYAKSAEQNFDQPTEVQTN
jgi:hypothetical protein